MRKLLSFLIAAAAGQMAPHLTQLKEATEYNVNNQLLDMLVEHDTLDDEFFNKMLISPRPGVNHLLYDEVMKLILELKSSFPNIIKLESIGKSYEDRDIWMLKLDAHRFLERNGLAVNTQNSKERKAILLTGAHHARELVSVQMVLYSILEMLHGLVHLDPEKLILLQRNKYFFVPVVNVDGSQKIMDHYDETGELLFKRKNMNPERQTQMNIDCGDMEMGVDINRNYAYNWEADDSDPCSESYPGHHAFSEPESIAMKNLMEKYHDTIKIVYNYHSYGPMFVWPYNSESANHLAEVNPLAQQILNEIWDDGDFPETTIKGNAIKTVGYLANGEANDWILNEYGIPSVSPELANDDFYSNDFFLPYAFVARSVVRDNHHWLFHTYKKLAGQMSLQKNATYEVQPEHNYVSLNMTLQNIGLQDWSMSQDPFQVRLVGADGHVVAMRRISNLASRETANINVTLPNQAGHQLIGKDDKITLYAQYYRFVSDLEPTTEEIVFSKK